MNTLKLTTLTMLIPFGWALSVDAYPRILEDTGVTLELVPLSTCHAEAPGRPFSETRGQKQENLLFDGEQYPFRGRHDTSSLHADRSARANVCRLDLESQDIN